MANNVQDDDVTQVDQGTGEDIDLSSLAGMNQPLEGGGMPAPPANLPGGIATPQSAPPIGPGMQPRPAPTVSQQAESHGGLLTGLAGVLLDGLNGGMMAQASAPLYGAPGSTFARGFENQQNMPLIKQQKQQAMWDSFTKVEQDKALMAQSYMNQLMIHMQSMRLSDDVRSNMMDSDRVMADQAIEEGWGTRLATTSGPTGRQQAMSMVHDLRVKDTNFQDQYFAYPLDHDDQGNPTDWQVVKLDPNATLDKDQTINYPYVDATTGEVKEGSYTVHAGTPVKNFIATREGLLKGATSSLPSAEKSAETAARKAQETNVVAAMPDGTQRVMTQAEADQQKFPHFPLRDPMLIQQTAFALNDVQNKFNQLSQVNFSNVQPELAAALIEKDAPELKGFIHVAVPERLAAGLRAENLAEANQDTKDYIVAIEAANEAITQLPRLQTFGRSSRFSPSQVEAAQKMLPLPGDTSDAGFSAQKMRSLQGMVDPLRRGLPQMEGVTLTPTFLEGGRAQPGTVLGGGARPAGAVKQGTDRRTGQKWWLDKDNKPLQRVQ